MGQSVNQTPLSKEDVARLVTALQYQITGLRRSAGKIGIPLAKQAYEKECRDFEELLAKVQNG